MVARAGRPSAFVVRGIGYAYRPMGKRRRKRERETPVMTVDDAADGETPGGGASAMPEVDTRSEGDASTLRGSVPAEAEAARADDAPAPAEAEAAPADDAPAPAFDDPLPSEAVRRAAEAIWVASQKGAPWATLALVPAEPGLRTDALARAVADVGTEQRGEPVDFLDLRDVTLANSRSLVETLALAAAFRHVVALGCPTDNRAAELLATAAAAVVLVVEREATRLDAARRVVEAVGPDRFLGAVVVEPER